jgi:plastocyanin
MRMRRFVPRAVCAGVLLLAAPAAAAPHSYTVVMDKLKFGPVPAELRRGDTIVWVNRDFLRHTATAADHSFDVDLMPGKSSKTVLRKAGPIPFVCRFHPGMRAVLQVK